MSLKGYILSLIIFYGLVKNFSRYSAHLVMILNMDDWLALYVRSFSSRLVNGFMWEGIFVPLKNFRFAFSLPTLST
jgi:cell shape-determining protein MreD